MQFLSLEESESHYLNNFLIEIIIPILDINFRIKMIEFRSKK